MCGRLVSITGGARLAEWFGAEYVAAEEPGPSWNVAPGQRLHVVVQGRDGLRLGTMRWGLVPSWSTDPSSGSRPINARAESLLQRAVFADAAARRRCVVVADGFYEWDATRRPVHLSSPDGAPLAMAAVWDRWTSPVGGVLLTVAVVTTAAGPDVAALHDRMPALLGESAWRPWLDGRHLDATAACSLLGPAPAGTLTARPASRAVNVVANDGPELLTPSHEPAQLF